MKSLRTEKKVYFKSVISVTRHNSRHMFSCVDENNDLKRMIVGLNVIPDTIHPVACMIYLTALFTSSAEHGRGYFDIFLLKRSIDFFLITELSLLTSCETMFTKAARGRRSHTYKKYKKNSLEQNKSKIVLQLTAQELCHPYMIPKGVNLVYPGRPLEGIKGLCLLISLSKTVSRYPNTLSPKTK